MNIITMACKIRRKRPNINEANKIKKIIVSTYDQLRAEFIKYAKTEKEHSKNPTCAVIISENVQRYLDMFNKSHILQINVSIKQGPQWHFPYSALMDNIAGQFIEQYVYNIFAHTFSTRQLSNTTGKTNDKGENLGDITLQDTTNQLVYEIKSYNSWHNIRLTTKQVRNKDNMIFILCKYYIDKTNIIISQINIMFGTDMIINSTHPLKESVMYNIYQL